MTKTPFEYGVQSYNDYGPARAFFQRLNVSIGTPPPRARPTARYVDFSTGLPVDYVPASSADQQTAFQKFLNVTAPFENYLLPGYWNFPAPSDIPADLLLPFGEFVTKHGIHAAVNQIFEVTGLGVGDFQNALTMFVLGAFGAPMIRSMLQQAGTITPASRRNIELYEAIQSRLASSTLLNSVVTQSERTPTGHTLWVRNSQTGKCTLVRARKLLISIEPTPENMAPFSLDEEERTVFSKFRWQTVHAGIVAHPALPMGVSLVNTPATAAPNRYLEVPKGNLIARFDNMGSNSSHFRVLMVGNETFGVEQAQRLVRENFASFVKAGTLQLQSVGDAASAAETDVKIRAWADHGAMHMHVSAEEIRKGFIQRLYALQGRRATWWTGGAFSVQFQAVLWAFDDTLLPKIIAG